METADQEFFHDLRQTLMANVVAEDTFQIDTFIRLYTDNLREMGIIEDFEFCHYRTQRGMRVDGYWFTDEDTLDIFIADFENRKELASLSQRNVTDILNRVKNFFAASADKRLYQKLEETSPGYGLARDIHDRKHRIRKINFFLISERSLSKRLQVVESDKICDIPADYHIWSVSRLRLAQSSRGHKEALNIDFTETFGSGLSCLAANIGPDPYPSYLVVMPGEILSKLYEEYGSRLLEQNVRSFLQVRGKVNKGIRKTILDTPNMFFAYNNGITATAQEAEILKTKDGLQITQIKDLQIVNGGQTTASLFHTAKKDQGSLKEVFVQMKLSVIDSEDSETIIPNISKYANTQNRVNAADFFSNNPFHIRIQEFSRRIWAPSQRGVQRETKWFYERTRGQYNDECSKLATQGQRKRFQAEYPKSQMFTKTDLAKFENVWDDLPKHVNLGAQKNFARYAERIGKKWDKSPDDFNEFYYQRIIARALIFRQTEKIVSSQPWYSGGYRANIVAYAIAALSEICKQHKKSVDFKRIWNKQELPTELINAITISAKFVNPYIMEPPQGISNISEWCKKDACWQRIQEQLSTLGTKLPKEFWSSLISSEEQSMQEKNARKIQKVDDGINTQKQALQVSPEKWGRILDEGKKKRFLSAKEINILRIAKQMPKKIPTEKQCAVLLAILQKAEEEGVISGNT